MSERAHAGPAGAEIDRAVRLLRLRSRREAVGLFAGSNVSPFRGPGLEFEESRPYVAGDDVTALDWRATARTGRLHTRHLRAERSHTLILAIDTSATMAFRTGAESKAAYAARTVALLVAAAARAGDRAGLVVFDAAVRERIAPGRGGAHSLRLVRCAVERALHAGGGANLAAALPASSSMARRRASFVLLSDFRDPALRGPGFQRALAGVAARHDVIALGVRDPAEIELPAAGPLRLADPAQAATPRLISSSRARIRSRYADATEDRRREVDGRLRAAGAETRWLRTDESPLRVLAPFFAARAARGRLR